MCRITRVPVLWAICLKVDFPGDYATLGFLFSKGSFTAVTQVGDKFQGINTQTLEDDPKLGSLNDVMFRAKAEVFSRGTFRFAKSR